ncbi:hypothetical protein FQZ97_959160 [compost metagenome]
MLVPSVLALPWPVAGWVRLTTESGVLPSGSLSLASTFRVSGTPRVAPVSATATGGWLGLTVTVTVACADTSPRTSWAR